MLFRYDRHVLLTWSMQARVFSYLRPQLSVVQQKLLYHSPVTQLHLNILHSCSITVFTLFNKVLNYCSLCTNIMMVIAVYRISVEAVFVRTIPSLYLNALSL